MVRGGVYGSPSLRQDQFVGVVRGNILDEEHLENLVRALAGDGSGNGKSEGGRGVAHFCHALHSRSCHMPPKDCRASGEDKEETVGKRDPRRYQGQKSVPDLPPRRAEREAEDGSLHYVAVQDNRRRRQTCAECSLYLRRL